VTGEKGTVRSKAGNLAQKRNWSRGRGVDTTSRQRNRKARFAKKKKVKETDGGREKRTRSKETQFKKPIKTLGSNPQKKNA